MARLGERDVMPVVNEFMQDRKIYEGTTAGCDLTHPKLCRWMCVGISKRINID